MLYTCYVRQWPKPQLSQVWIWRWVEKPIFWIGHFSKIHSFFVRICTLYKPHSRTFITWTAEYCIFPKGAGSQDRLDVCYHAWVDIGISKSRDRFLTFIDDAPSGKNSFFQSMWTPLRYYTRLSAHFWSKLSCFSLTEGICKIASSKPLNFYHYGQLQYTPRGISYLWKQCG
jgi:hypothetical protein